MSTATLKVVSPVDGSIYAELPLASEKDIDNTLNNAKRAQAAWRHSTIAERAALALRFTEAFVAMKDEVVPELAWQMGRPIAYGGGVVCGFVVRVCFLVVFAG